MAADKPDQSPSYEGLAFNPENNYFYTAGRTSVKRGREKMGVHSPWSWNTIHSGVDSPRAVEADASVTSGVESHNIYLYDRNFGTGGAVVTVPMVDDTTESGDGGLKVYAGAGGHLLGIETDETNGDSNYYRRNPSGTWSDTGVSRVSAEQWVFFRVMLAGVSVLYRISTDYKTTWSDAGSSTDSVGLGQRNIGAETGAIRVGDFHVTPIFRR